MNIKMQSNINIFINRNVFTLQPMLYRVISLFARKLFISKMLGFGKHVGKSLTQIAQEDPEYMKWLSKYELVEKNGMLRIKNDPEICNFGKHAGLTWKEIAEKHPDYLRWMKATGDLKLAYAIKKVESYSKPEEAELPPIDLTDGSVVYEERPQISPKLVRN